jgi:hypothetical protein
VFDLLTQLATEGVAENREFLGRTRFAISEADHSFAYDLDPIPAHAVLSSGDPYGIPLEALIRVVSLRRDFRATVSAEDFWVTPLDSIQEAVRMHLAR